MPIDQQWVGDVLRDYGGLVYVDIVDIVYDIDASTLAGVGWLDNPNILLALIRLQLHVVAVEVAKLIRQNVGVWSEVKCGLPKLFLETHDVEAEAILPGDLVTHREVIDLLVFVKTLVLVALAGARGPEDVPIVGVGDGKAVLLKY